jgi:hypothetical protein
VFQLKSIAKTLVNVQKNILSFIFLIQIIGFVAKGSIKSRLSTINYDKKRKLGLLVQRAKGFLVRMVRRKKT